MLLCIDIGNTNITLGLYEGTELGLRWRLATDQKRMPDEYALQVLGLLAQAAIPVASVDRAVIASVVPPLTDRWVQLCQNYLHCDPLVVSYKLRTGINIKYEDPNAVGADRIADATAAFCLYGGPACIIDFGTATTFNALTVEGHYLGGAIAPGIGMAADALFEHTSKLPRVELARPPAAIGSNTTHAIQSGLIFGYVGLVEGMVARFKAELGPETRVIGTGGVVEIIAKETSVIQVVAPWLTLDGMRMIYEMNHEN